MQLMGNYGEGAEEQEHAMTIDHHQVGAHVPRPTTRPSLDRGLLGCLGLAALLAVLANGHAWFGGHPTHSLATPGGDIAEQVWFLAWLPHALLHLQNPFISHALFAGSGGVNLMVNTSEFAPALVLAPLTVLVGPVFAFNVGLVLAPVVSAWPMYVLVRRIVGRRWIATTTATMWAMSPYVLANLPSGRFHQTVQFIEPVVLLLALDLVQERRRPVTVGFLAASAIVVQYFTGSEQLAMVAFEVGLGLVVAAVFFRSTLHAVARRALVAVGVAGGVSVFFLAYPLWVEFFGPRHTTGSPWGSIFELGNSLTSIVATPRLFGRGDAVTGYVGGVGTVGETLAFLGWGVVATCLATILWQWNDRRVRALAIVGVITVVLELGTTVQVSTVGVATLSWAPWRLFANLPVVEQLIPDRFAQMVAFAALLLVALGWRALTDLLEPAAPRVRRSIVIVAVLAATLPQILGAPVPFPSSSSFSQSTWYATIHGTPGHRARVLVLPSVNAGLGWSSAPMTYQALNGFRFDLLGGYVLVPTTHGAASAWLVPPTGPDGVLQGFMSPFQVTALSAQERAVIAKIITVRHVTDVLLFPIAGNNNLADAELTAIMGTRPAMRDFVLLWRSVHEVHPLDLSDAVIEGCAASTAGKAPLATADCVLAAAALPS